MKIAKALVCALALAGCSTTPANLDSKTAPVVRSYPENYQEIYRRVSGTAKRCLTKVIYSSSVEVDSELYSELGYGEVQLSISTAFGRNYYWNAKIEDNGEGSTLTVHAGNSLATDSSIRSVLRWAGGDPSC